MQFVSSAQRSPKQVQITTKDKERIERNVNYLFNESFKSLLVILTNTDNKYDIDDKRQAISNSLSDIFQSRESQVEYDLKSLKSSGQNMKPADEYLNLIVEEIKPNSGGEVVTFDFRNSDFKYFQNKDIVYCIVNYVHKWNAQDADKNKLKSTERKAIIKLDNSEKGWIVHIESLLFENSDDHIQNSSDWQRIVIQESNEQVQAFKNKSYYEARYQQGVSLLSRQEYAKAYYCLTESKEFTWDADSKVKIDDKISSLKKALSNSSGSEDESWEKMISRKLKSEAEKYENQKNYPEALNYILLAKKANRSDESKALTTAIERITNEAQKMNALENLYQNGKYEDAIIQYNKEIKLEPDNSYLYAGLGRCYSLSSAKSADSCFDLAFQHDPKNLKALKWQAEYLKANRKFTEAEKSYIKYISIADPNDPETKTIMANKSLCRVSELFSKNPGEAKDSCLSALQNDDRNPDAYLWLSKLALVKKSYNLFPNETKKQDYTSLAGFYADSAIAMGMKSEGYLQKAKILNDKKRNTDKEKNSKEWKEIGNQIINSLENAINTDKRNYVAYMELGEIYLSNAYEALYSLKSKADNFKLFNEDIQKAILAFEVPAKDAAWSNRKTAVWKLAKCKYLNSSYEEADKLMLSIKDDMEYTQAKEQFFADYGLIKLKRGQLNDANFFLGKSNTSLGKYGLLLYNIKKDPNRINDYNNTLNEIFEALDTYSSSMIEDDFKELGIENAMNSQVKKALKSKAGH